MAIAAKCRTCGKAEDLAEPLIDGTCPDCLRKSSGVSAKQPLPPPLPHQQSQAVSSRAFRQPNSIAPAKEFSAVAAVDAIQSWSLVVVSGVLEIISIGATACGGGMLARPETSELGSIFVFIGGVAIGVSTILLIIGLIRWAIAPYAAILVRQNDLITKALNANREQREERSADGAPGVKNAEVMGWLEQ